MSQIRPEILSSSIQKADIWLKELKEDMRLASPDQAYGALRAVLHALRDRLTVETAAHLAAQLPTILRGVFYDGYKPSAVPSRIRSRAEFLEDIRERARGHAEFDAYFAVESVFRLIEQHVEPGLIRKLVDQMPGELREFWPDRYILRRPMDGERGRAMPGWGRRMYREMERMPRHAMGNGRARNWMMIGTIGAVAMVGLALTLRRSSSHRTASYY